MYTGVSESGSNVNKDIKLTLSLRLVHVARKNKQTKLKEETDCLYGKSATIPANSGNRPVRQT